MTVLVVVGYIIHAKYFAHQSHALCNKLDCWPFAAAAVDPALLFTQEDVDRIMNQEMARMGGSKRSTSTVTATPLGAPPATGTATGTAPSELAGTGAGVSIGNSNNTTSPVSVSVFGSSVVAVPVMGLGANPLHSTVGGAV